MIDTLETCYGQEKSENLCSILRKKTPIDRKSMIIEKEISLENKRN